MLRRSSKTRRGGQGSYCAPSSGWYILGQFLFWGSQVWVVVRTSESNFWQEATVYGWNGPPFWGARRVGTERDANKEMGQN
ncbi:hypothetical protein LY76DRAFT_592413 [Colletotrichum caudatum]|nr:hypothetical protein LY76DRAFT_592413 [Colletotrichum caudatum]